MAVTSREFFSNVSIYAYHESTAYKYAKHIDRGTAKKKEGVITVLKWYNELSYHYLQKEKALQEEFFQATLAQGKFLNDTLLDGDYKDGVKEGFDIGANIIERAKEEKQCNMNGK